MKQAVQKYSYWIPIVLHCVFYIFKAAAFPAGDFANYYFGGKFLADGHFNAAVYFPYEFNKAIADLGYSNIFVSYAPNTPFLAVLFVPFSLLPLAAAKILFNCISVLLFLFSLKKIVLHYKIPDFYVLLIPVLFFVPIKNELLFGQVYFLLFFLLSESWLAYEKKMFFKMSILLAVAILLKVFPALLVLVFVFKKQFIPLLYLVFCGLFLMAFSMLFTGINIWEFYFFSVLPKASNGEIAGEYVANYQSVFMFLKQLLVYDKTWNPTGFDLPVLFVALLLAFKIKLVAIGFYISRKANNSLFVLAYWIVAMVLISPYGSTYTFILLIFPVFALVKSPYSTVVKTAAFLLLMLVNFIPVAQLVVLPFPVSYLRLFALLGFFGILVWMMIRYVNLKIISVVVVVPFLLVLILKKKEMVVSDCVLKNPPILIYDFKVSGNELTYYYWNENGENRKTIAFEAKHNISSKIKHNQVFYNGKKMATDSGHKSKALVIDKKILYLSDFGRGIGFYNLRMVSVK
ncbi:hypothetical protein FNO01nite_03290 [Flavobacterium noncentrifugens]|uniref:DUF2029 domain-containing protein n=1 Tax=Flavobacterium noncentrifugens TaxID=1128970 RepID=A0A1G8S0X4_9FLAO|nr:glycosyltransferase family 87 protein [Flavobacterium noncentrifugens]GEP49657.1 hypothetical protein FNO01nite_03290 [Flavobacterium noncentrifugens]SDJ22859.1 Protein of unknown function [Flavobacterium noncentrifugens]